MAQDAEEFLRRDREKEEIKEIKERIELLDDKINGVQRALVECRAVCLSQYIHFNWMLKILRLCSTGEGEWVKMIKEHDKAVIGLNYALASLRGKLSEEAIPEDAYKYWEKAARKGLSRIVGAENANSLIAESSDWGKIIGFLGLEVEE